jgi:hypothetical protein
MNRLERLANELLAADSPSERRKRGILLVTPSMMVAKEEDDDTDYVDGVPVADQDDPPEPPRRWKGAR